MRALSGIGYLGCLVLLAACGSPAASNPDAAPQPECATAETCPSSESPCSVATCDQGVCGFATAEAGTVCREATGACDAVETCDGASATCPDDVMAAAGTECRSAADVCDAVETCDGAATTCPEDSGIASLCQPVAPITYDSLGRSLTIRTIDLAGTGTPVATSAPGAEVSLRVVGAWVDSNTSCPGCITQFYVRLNNVFSLCLGSTTEDLQFDRSTTFTAPTTPGVYIINPVSSWLFSCADPDPPGASTDFSASSVATLIVE